MKNIIDTLTKKVRGAVITPSDPDYDKAATGATSTSCPAMMKPPCGCKLWRQLRAACSREGHLRPGQPLPRQPEHRPSEEELRINQTNLEVITHRRRK
jgi:hypothetical protein